MVEPGPALGDLGGPAAAPDLLTAAFELIAESGLDGFSLSALAARTGRSLVAVYEELPGRRALFAALGRRVDAAMLGFEATELAGLPPRDRAFELIMRRLDALAPFRAGLARLEREAPRDPVLALLAGCRLERAMRYLQDAAGLRRSGLRARLQRAALGAVYARTLRVWLRDESADLATTMAELDKGLRRIEPIAGLRERGAGPANEEPLAGPV